MIETGSAVSFSAAFLAGILTFLSPCILPLIPVYVSYITGVSFDELKGEGSRAIRKKTFVHSLLFVLGFSLIFITLGASISYLGQFLINYRAVISRTGGVIVIIFGLYVMGIFKLGFLDREKRITFRLQRGTKAGAALLGVTFAAATTPCVDPVLASVLVLAATRESALEGAYLLSIYSLGIAVPFVISALLINSFLAHFAKFRKWMAVVKFVCGLLLVIMGFLLIGGRFPLL